MNELSTASLELGIELPGRAGELQRGRDTRGLVAELGDNYGRYHAALVQLLAATGGRPEPEQFDDDMVAYYDACDALENIIKAEAFLRRCRATRRLGRMADAVRFDEPTLDDERWRLVSVETGRPTGQSLPGATAARRIWSDPPHGPGITWPRPL